MFISPPERFSHADLHSTIDIGAAPQSPVQGVEWQLPAIPGRAVTAPVAEDGGNQMAKGQVKKEKSNKPKLSTKEKKKAKASKKAAKAAK